MSPITCIYTGSFLESDRFLAYALHSLTSIEIPLHIFGAYLIIFKTPKSMNTAKFSILQLHILCTVMDLTVTSLWTFYIWLPSPSGFPVGLMTNFGIDSTFQAFFAFNVMLAVALTYISFFENRYDVVVIGQVGRSKRRNLYRMIYFIINIIFAESCLSYIFLKMPDKDQARARVHETQPCIPLEFINNPNYMNLNAGDQFIPYVTGTMVISLCLQGLYFVGYTTYHLFIKTTNVSRHTRNIQRKFFLSMFLQAVIPASSFAAPLYGYSFLYTIDLYNQTYNNLLMVAIGCNGLLTTLVMILVHHPYRNAVRDMCRVRKIENMRSTVPTLNLKPLVMISGG